MLFVLFESAAVARSYNCFGSSALADLPCNNAAKLPKLVKTRVVLFSDLTIMTVRCSGLPVGMVWVCFNCCSVQPFCLCRVAPHCFKKPCIFAQGGGMSGAHFHRLRIHAEMHSTNTTNKW